MLDFSRVIVGAALIALLAACGGGADASTQLGSKDKPLRVLMIPADGGTEEGTRADYEPIFRAVQRERGLHFDIRVGQSYQAVVEGMVGGKVDIAFFGPVTYHEARQRGAAELLAVAVSGGESSYYSGLFVRADLGIESLDDLAGKKIAFGDMKSTSSFHYPVAMLLAAGIDPATDLDAIYLTGSHANSLAALAAGRVDVAGASLSSYEKAVNNGNLDEGRIRLLAKSEPIPYPPLAMHTALPDALKQELRSAFAVIHEAEGVTPEMVRGYGGKRVDRYDTAFAEDEFTQAIQKLVAVTDDVKSAILTKAGKN